MPAGTRVLGTVVNAKGQPVAFADVESIAAAEWSTEAVVAHCDEQGRFTLENAAHLLLLRARAHGYQPGLADFVLAEGPPSFELELVLGAPASTLRGQVLRPAGLPAAGAEVLIAFPSGEDEPASLPKHTTPTPQPLDLVSVRCDSEGRFASDEIPEGPLLLFATSDEGPESVWQEYWLQGTGQVSLTLGPAGRLRLEVEGQGGAPLPSDVQLRLLWMGSDTLGPFWPGAAAALRHRRPLRGAMAEFDGLLPGRYQVQVERCPDPTAPWSQCWYSGEVDVLAGEVTSQRIQLRVPERIEVHMTDEAGEPLAGWTVAAVAAGDSEIDPAAPPAVLDEHGRAVLFAASGTESGELLLIAPGGVSTARWRGHWSKGQPDPIAPPRESDLPRASLRGRLPWATPPSSGELLLEYEGDASARQLPLDEQGRFAADYLPAGSFQLLWEDADAETSIPIAVGTLPAARFSSSAICRNPTEPSSDRQRKRIS
ncbi:MAG: carboxypeptidase-like regulatory domain-containing protein [Planctomycetota bacterium]